MKQRLNMPLRIKAIHDSGEFSGYGSVFGIEDDYGDIVKKGAFADSLSEFKKAGRAPAMLWQHNIDEPIGIWTKMIEDDHGLVVEGRLLVDDDPLAKRAHAHLKAGSLDGLSIGYNLPKGGYEYDEESDTFTLFKIELWEVSLVTFPANADARVDEVKRALAMGDGLPSLRVVERTLRDVGFSHRQAKAFMSDGYKGLSLRDAGGSLETIHNITARVRLSK